MHGLCNAADAEDRESLHTACIAEGEVGVEGVGRAISEEIASEQFPNILLYGNVQAGQDACDAVECRHVSGQWIQMRDRTHSRLHLASGSRRRSVSTTSMIHCRSLFVAGSPGPRTLN